MLKVGQTVKAQVLAVDTEKRQLRLGMKQLVPTGVDEYIAEHKVGDIVSGRLMEVSGLQAPSRIRGRNIRELPYQRKTSSPRRTKPEARVDLSSLTSMLQARWKGGASNAKPEPVKAGQVRSFRITQLDPPNKKIEVELA